MRRGLGFAVFWLAGWAAAGSVNMLGRQSQNEGVLIVPAPGKVTIDGRLNDWDFSGRVWCFADKSVRDRYSAQAACMWDKSFLYLAARWKDPTPMFSTIDPEFNPNDGWKSDSWQLRVRTDRSLWVTTWFFTPRKQPVMHIDYWLDKNNSRGDHRVAVLKAAPGGTDLGRGVQMAYRKDPDGKGCVQELRIPWPLLFEKVPEVKPGLVFQLGLEFLWGDPTGKTWPIHRYADNMQPGATSREFFWDNWRVWGTATLVARGNVELRRYVSAAEVLQGTVPIRSEIPDAAASFTLVIEDREGNRVRNLAGGLDPDDYTVARRDGRRMVEVLWDCLDDWGRLVRPGRYRTRGVVHRGLDATYEMTFYNPGAPPWQTRDGSGAWGADHTAPLRVAASGQWVVLSWPFAEGGSGLVGIGPDGRKKWGEKRGATILAADERFAYAIVASWHVKVPTLCRFAAGTGDYEPFVKGGKARPFELHLSEVVNLEEFGEPLSMASDGKRLVVGFERGKLAALDAASAELLKAFDVPRPSCLAFAPDGMLLGVLDGQVCRIDLEGDRHRPLRLPGLGAAGPLTTDREGNIVVADLGGDRQVKVYAPARALFGRSRTRYRLLRAIGIRGGRPLRGKFIPEGLTDKIASVAVDAKGQVWVVEHWDYPRRVSVWRPDGSLVRDYIGNTGYAGTGCYLHDSDPTLAYCGPIEMKLDKKTRTWRVTRLLWVPDRQKGESFRVPMGAALPQRFTSEVSGKPREYLFCHPYDAQSGVAVFVERDGQWQPAAAVCYAGHISGRINHYGIVEEEPSGELAGLNAYDGVFWNDANRDGRVQRPECKVVPARRPAAKGKRGEGPFPLRSGWGGRIGRDLVFYTNGLYRFRPLRLTEDGAPVYGPEGMKKLPVDENGDLVPVPEEDLLLCVSFKGYGNRTTGILGFDTRSWKLLWSYPNPYPGVHGSHRAPMPRPGLVIGPLKICGVAKVNEGVGRVFLMRGNLGQDYFMTTDGLLVSALFQDGRLPAEPLPPREADLLGKSLKNFTHGSEPFNGWFGKQADGVVRTTCGFAREAAMVLRVHGLETVQRFSGPTVALDNATILKANAENIARAGKKVEPKELTVRRLARPPKIDARSDDWRGVSPARVEVEGSPEGAAVRLAYDGSNLYFLVEVRDPSPWLNEGKDFSRLFKTGDAFDIQLNTDPASPAKRDKLLPTDVRLVFAPLGGRPACVVMRPIVPGTPPEKRVRYHSPVGDRYFDRVAILPEARLAVRADKAAGRYALEGAVPLGTIGLKPRPGMSIRGDFGFISSDALGRVDVARNYWANPHTNVVSDLPTESWLYPAHWGALTFH